MKKIHIIVIAIVLLTGLLSAYPGDYDHCPKEDPGMDQKFEKKHHEGMKMYQMAEELELTEAQIESFHELKLEHEKFMIKTRSEIEILKLDKQVAMKDKDFAEVKKITEAIFNKKEMIALKMIDLHEGKWDMLTNEQKEKAEELKHSQKKCPQMMPKKMETHEGMGMKKHM